MAEEHDSRQAWCWRSSRETETDRQTDRQTRLGMDFWHLKIHLQWHTSSNKAILPNSFNPFKEFYSLVTKHSIKYVSLSYGGHSYSNHHRPKRQNVHTFKIYHLNPLIYNSHTIKFTQSNSLNGFYCIYTGCAAMAAIWHQRTCPKEGAPYLWSTFPPPPSFSFYCSNHLGIACVATSVSSWCFL